MNVSLPGTGFSWDIGLRPQTHVWCTRSVLLSHNIKPDNAFRPWQQQIGWWAETKSKEASEGRNDLFTPESIKDALSVLFLLKCPVQEAFCTFFLSVSGKWTWKYTELAVITCEGLFDFKGNVEGKKQADADACVSEWAKPRWGTWSRVGRVLDDVVWTNLPEWMVWIYWPTTVKLS